MPPRRFLVRFDLRIGGLIEPARFGAVDVALQPLLRKTGSGGQINLMAQIVAPFPLIRALRVGNAGRASRILAFDVLALVELRRLIRLGDALAVGGKPGAACAGCPFHPGFGIELGVGGLGPLCGERLIRVQDARLALRCNLIRLHTGGCGSVGGVDLPLRIRPPRVRCDAERIHARRLRRFDVMRHRGLGLGALITRGRSRHGILLGLRETGAIGEGRNRSRIDGRVHIAQRVTDPALIAQDATPLLVGEEVALQRGIAGAQPFEPSLVKDGLFLFIGVATAAVERGSVSSIRLLHPLCGERLIRVSVALRIRVQHPAL